MQSHNYCVIAFSPLIFITCRIIETPADAAPVAPAAYYLGPSEDGTRPGVFMVNTYKHHTR